MAILMALRAVPTGKRPRRRDGRGGRSSTAAVSAYRARDLPMGSATSSSPTPSRSAVLRPVPMRSAQAATDSAGPRAGRSSARRTASTRVKARGRTAGSSTIASCTWRRSIPRIRSALPRSTSGEGAAAVGGEVDAAVGQDGDGVGGGRLAAGQQPGGVHGGVDARWRPGARAGGPRPSASGTGWRAEEEDPRDVEGSRGGGPGSDLGVGARPDGDTTGPPTDVRACRDAARPPHACPRRRRPVEQPGRPRGRAAVEPVDLLAEAARRAAADTGAVRPREGARPRSTRSGSCRCCRGATPIPVGSSPSGSAPPTCARPCTRRWAATRPSRSSTASCRDIAAGDARRRADRRRPRRGAPAWRPGPRASKPNWTVQAEGVGPPTSASATSTRWR